MPVSSFLHELQWKERAVCLFTTHNTNAESTHGYNFNSSRQFYTSYILFFIPPLFYIHGNAWGKCNSYTILRTSLLF